MLESLINSGFLPHGYCLQWRPDLLWMHAVSDLAIALAYFSIPAMIVYYLRKRTAITEIGGIYLLIGGMFACFIVFCGVTHVLGLVTLWQPAYGLQGVMKAATAVVSVATALALVPILPRALTLRTAEELEAINLNLEREIAQREAREQELKESNAKLKAEIEARSRAEEGEQKAVEARDELERTLHDLRATQARLVESEKLASLGKFMAGIAHEVNTPVGVSVTAASTLRNETDEINKALADSTLSQNMLSGYLEQAGESIDMIERNLDRASTLLQSVKQIATDQSNDQIREIGVREYVELVLRSIKPKIIASHHPVQLDCPQKLTLNTRPGAFSQVITNLIVNALTHAYPDGREGEIRVVVSTVESGIQVRCEDDGVGIPPEHRERIFEPFFTTLGGDGGSGIGLDMVHMLVTEKMNGRIAVESNSQGGAVFKVQLPNLSSASETASAGGVNE